MAEYCSASALVRASGMFASLTSRYTRGVSIAIAAGAGTKAATKANGTVRMDGGGGGVITDIETEEGRKEIKGEKYDTGTAVRSIGEQLSFGGALGFAAGFTIRKVGKAVLFLIGAEVVVLQYMSYRRWVHVDWHRMSKDLSPKLSRSTWDSFLQILLYRLPFSAAFSGGLYASLRMSGN